MEIPHQVHNALNDLYNRVQLVETQLNKLTSSGLISRIDHAEEHIDTIFDNDDDYSKRITALEAQIAELRQQLEVRSKVQRPAEVPGYEQTISYSDVQPLVHNIREHLAIMGTCLNAMHERHIACINGYLEDILSQFKTPQMGLEPQPMQRPGYADLMKRMFDALEEAQPYVGYMFEGLLEEARLTLAEAGLLEPEPPDTPEVAEEVE